MLSIAHVMNVPIMFSSMKGKSREDVKCRWWIQAMTVDPLYEISTSDSFSRMSRGLVHRRASSKVKVSGSIPSIAG